MARGFRTESCVRSSCSAFALSLTSLAISATLFILTPFLLVFRDFHACFGTHFTVSERAPLTTPAL
jgi:hypothetical protein